LERQDLFLDILLEGLPFAIGTIISFFVMPKFVDGYTPAEYLARIGPEKFVFNIFLIVVASVVIGALSFRQKVKNYC